MCHDPHVVDRSAESLQHVSVLSPEQQVVLETANVTRSLEYARDTLGLPQGMSAIGDTVRARTTTLPVN